MIISYYFLSLQWVGISIMIFQPLMNIGILFVICLIMSIMYDIDKYTIFLRKLGPAVGAAAIMGGSSILGSTLGLLGSEDEVDTNVAENQKNRKFNAEEAEKQRAWSHDEWDYQFAKQTAEWYNQQDYSNAEAFDYWMQQQDYNSPVAQVKRMQSAGLNPAHVVGDTTFGSTGLSAAPTSVPNPSVPSGHAASVGLSNPASPGAKAQAFANMAKGISDVINSVYGARRSAAETEKTERTLDPIIKGLLLDNSNKQLVNTWQQLDNMEKEKGMPDRLKNLSNQGKFLIAQAMAATSSSELMNVQKELDNLRKGLVSKEIDIKGKELLIITAEADNIQTAIDLKNELLRQQSNTEKSRQAANYSSAEESHSRAVTETEFRPIRKRIVELERDLDEKTLDYKVRDWWQKTQFNDQRIFLDAIELKDKQAYNAFQRVILGHGNAKDKRLVLDLIKSLSDGEMLSSAVPK